MAESKYNALAEDYRYNKVELAATCTIQKIIDHAQGTVFADLPDQPFQIR